MKLDAYEYISLVIPGSVVALVLTLLSPDIRDVIAKNGMDLGGFGIVVLVALVSGYLIQALGNWIESAQEWMGIDPSEQLRLRGKGPVSASQFNRANELLKAKGHDDLSNVSVSDWRGLRGEMAAEIRAHDNSSRLDVMLRMYGLGRGLISAFIVSMMFTLLFPDGNEIRWKYLIVLGIGLILSYFRARRFSQSYLRELIIGYVRVETSSKSKAEEKGKNNTED